MSNKIKLGDTEFDFDNPDHNMFLKGMAGGPHNGHREYQIALERLGKVFKRKENQPIKDPMLRLDYSELVPEYIDHYFPDRPVIELTENQLKKITEQESFEGLDVAACVLQRLSKIFNEQEKD